MDSIRLCVDTTEEGIEVVCAALNDLGFEQLEIVNDRKGMQADLAQSAPFWDYVEEEELLQGDGQTCVCAYFGREEAFEARVEDLKARLAQIKAMDLGLDLGTLQMKQETIREEDWRNNWRQFYKPMEIGERLMVVPIWEKDSLAENERVKLYLEPGLVFGTGEHQTTQLCLEALEKRVAPGDRVLDVGSGSGILSITSLLLGAGAARAIDIELNARQISYDNAALNGLQEAAYDVLVGDAIGDGKMQETIGRESYDLIVANIVADVIIQLSPLSKKWLKEEGVFISSGIIDERADEVQAAIEKAGFIIEQRQEKEGWVCFVARSLKGDAR